MIMPRIRKTLKTRLADPDLIGSRVPIDRIHNILADPDLVGSTSFCRVRIRNTGFKLKLSRYVWSSYRINTGSDCIKPGIRYPPPFPHSTPLCVHNNNNIYLYINNRQPLCVGHAGWFYSDSAQAWQPYYTTRGIARKYVCEIKTDGFCSRNF